MIRVTVWNEFQHERTQEKVKEIYPDGIHCKVSGTRGGAFGSDGCV
jgi:trehalose utilization protein